MLDYIDKEWDCKGTLYALIRGFSEEVESLQKDAPEECKDTIRQAIVKAGPAIKSATELLARYGQAENPLTLAEKYEWKRIFRWLHANLFVDDRPLIHDWVEPDHLTWCLENLQGVRQVVQQGYLLTEELPAPRIAEMFSLEVDPCGAGETASDTESACATSIRRPTATLEVSYLDPIVEHAKYMRNPSAFMDSTKGPDGRYKEHVIRRQKFRVPLDGNVESALSADHFGIPSLSRDYRTSETVWGTMARSLAAIAKEPVDESVSIRLRKSR